MTHQYKITGMTCGSCVARVKQQLADLDSVTHVDVQLQSPQATISMQQHIDIKDLQQAISKAGSYTISEITGHSDPTPPATGEDKPSYFPIALIFGYITGITALVHIIKGSFSWMQWMMHFMAGFFFVFSFFKFMNLRGFAKGYQTYDVVAKRFPVWGFIYPFVELLLAIALITDIDPVGTNIAVLLVMGVSSIGVIQSLLKKRPFQCACLGTVIKLPLSKVTLAEDVLMVVMSAVTIVLVSI